MRKTWLIRDGDLVLDDAGDFATLTGVDATLADVARELMAPILFQATTSWDYYGVLIMDELYGGFLQPLRNRPLKDLPVDVIFAGLRQILAKYEDLTLADLTLDPSAIADGVLRIVAPVTVAGTTRQFFIDIDGTMLEFTS